MLMLVAALLVGGRPASASNAASRTEAVGLDNLFELSPKVYSGATPQGISGFESLRKLGIKTIISVDGARPEVELARKHGLKYVHLPHGYDGIGTNLQARLIKAAQSSDGAVYVHCHLGKHRGPAAAAVVCMGMEEWTPTMSEEWLATAGTSPDYPGLYQTVRTFAKPPKELLETVPANLPEVAEVGGMVEAMVAIEQRMEKFKAIQKSAFAASEKSPDTVPSNEAVILRELFREAQRLPEARDYPAGFMEQMRSAEHHALGLETLLRKEKVEPSGLENSLKKVSQSCVSCHKAHRN